MYTGKVLVVDDEPDIVKTVCMQLTASGYEVISARDGMQATNLAMKELPDVILLDISMPAGDGHIVAKRLASDPKTYTIPIIFLTARRNPEDFREAFDEGVVRYITKPFNPDDLIIAIDTLVAEKRDKPEKPSKRQSIG